MSTQAISNEADNSNDWWPWWRCGGNTDWAMRIYQWARSAKVRLSSQQTRQKVTRMHQRAGAEGTVFAAVDSLRWSCAGACRLSQRRRRMSVPGCACTALPSLGLFGKRRLLASALSSTSRRPPWTGIPWHGTLSLVRPALSLWLSVSLSLLLRSLGLSAACLLVCECISVLRSVFLERDGNGLWLVLGKDLGI